LLKKRIIPILLLKDGRLVKGINFSNYRDVGNPISSAAVYNSQQADELIVLNIDSDSIKPLVSILKELSGVCFMPLTLGGGVKSFDDAALLIREGADKVVVNTLCYEAPDEVRKISDHFGKQALVCAIDVRYQEGQYFVFSKCGVCKEFESFEQAIKRRVSLGAGEILVQSIDHDGTMKGYDLNMVNYVSSIVEKLPILVSGGCGDYNDIKALFLSTSADAAVCGSLFNFSDSNPIRAKSFLSNYGIPLKKV
jgi:imidazole glycerol-phosphate synthase subunit HisF